MKRYIIKGYGLSAETDGVVYLYEKEDDEIPTVEVKVDLESTYPDVTLTLPSSQRVREIECAPEMRELLTRISDWDEPHVDWRLVDKVVTLLSYIEYGDGK